MAKPPRAATLGTADAGGQPVDVPVQWTRRDHDGDDASSRSPTADSVTTATPNYNPGAFDVPKDGLDEDCDGVVDDEADGLPTLSAPLAPGDGIRDLAQAMDLCRQTTETAQGKKRTWGVVSAKFVAPVLLGHVHSTRIRGWLGFGLTDPTSDPTSPWASRRYIVQAGREPGRDRASTWGPVPSGSARDQATPGTTTSYVPDMIRGKTTKAGTRASTLVFNRLRILKDTPACPGVVTGQPHDGAGPRARDRAPRERETASPSDLQLLHHRASRSTSAASTTTCSSS